MGTVDLYATGSEQLLVFILEGRKYALPLDAVEHVVRAVEVRPLPDAPSSVRGVIDVHGQVMPVVDLRRRFGLPAGDLDPQSQFLVTRTDPTSALVVDEAVGIIETTPDDAAQTIAGATGDDPCVVGVIPDGPDSVYVLRASALPSRQDQSFLVDQPVHTTPMAE